MKERVLITGGMSGIGAAIASECLACDYEAIIIDKQPGGIMADLSDERETEQALKQALAGGHITRLVNNVGIVAPADVDNQSLEELSLACSLNLRVALQCVQALLPGMRHCGFGRIINISSRAALGKVRRSAYAATKAGLIGMTRVWALELAQYGITVNAIAPGPIKTTLFDKANPTDSPLTLEIVNSIPVKKLGTPQDVARASSFFMDKDNGFITGQTLYVCGGMTIGKALI